MKKLLLILLCLPLFTLAQKKPQSYTNIEVNDGTFLVNFKNTITQEKVLNQFNDWVNLSSDHSFVKQSEKLNNQEQLYVHYSQVYKGIPVRGGSLVMREKDGFINHIHGKIPIFENLNTQPNISIEQALDIAKSNLNITDLTQSYPVKKLIDWNPKAKDYNAVLVYEIRIISSDPFLMYDVFVDANTGEVIKKVSLVCSADVTGNGNTLYSGNQSFTCDSYGSNYRLRDNGRNIHTYNAYNDSALIQALEDSTLNYEGQDFVSSSTDWFGPYILQQFTIQATPSTSWWYAFNDQTPDLYIKIRNGFNQVVYTSSVISIYPPVTFFNIDLDLTDPPYFVEVWEEDVFSDDYGGSINISSSSLGENSFYSTNVAGYYNINIDAINSSLDVHWGMQETYDYFLNTHQRDSYDYNGGVIRNFVNPNILNGFFGFPNNAAALKGGFNYMLYGMGGGMGLGPMVDLDVLGHEYTHLIAANTGDIQNGGVLDYNGESGALNESFADIFGACVEFNTAVNPNWLIGEESSSIFPFLRSMEDPSTTLLPLLQDSMGPYIRQPDTYETSPYWIDPTNTSIDAGGIHINSGVQNKWFYLLAEGDTGTNDNNYTYSVTGIGINDASAIAYKTLTEYMTLYSTYTDAYLFSLESAEDLFGYGSQQHLSVQDAWQAVGVNYSNICNDNIVNVNTDIIWGGLTYPWAINGLSWTINLLGDPNILAFGADDTTICLPDGCYEFVTYDNMGFGDSAIYTVNNITEQGVPSTTLFSVGNGSCCSNNPLTITITTDNYPTETSWSLLDQSGNIVQSISAGNLTQTDTTYTWDVCIDPLECYDFIIYDTYGDGICCAYGNGSYSLSYQGTVIATGGTFASFYTISNIICGTTLYGCTDPAATNYDPTATVDDGSCIYPSVCAEDAPTGLFVDGIIHSRAVINWDNMNSSLCVVDQYRIRYREVATSSWTQKTMGTPLGSCTWGNQRVDKLLLNLTGNTTYEYQMKAWYCGGGASSWTILNTFTTEDDCPNVGNLAVYGATTTKATFTWDASNGVYSFVRLKARIDSISNPSGSDWFQIGGAGVSYGIFTKNKNGLTPGETHRGQARAFCDPNGGAYFSLSWTPLVTWTQPTVRIEGGESITNLDVYPNPSRDVFNITFTSESVQDLRVRVLNVIGEELIKDDLQQFVGEYVKSINLNKYTKGIYFLEIETDGGVINKKLVLQ